MERSIGDPGGKLNDYGQDGGWLLCITRHDYALWAFFLGWGGRGGGQMETMVLGVGQEDATEQARA